MVYNRFEYTKQKLSEGVSQRQIARDLGIDHGTIAYWIRNNFSTGSRNSIIYSDNEIIELCNNNSPQYAYLLGSYLGDGHITKMSRTFKLTIYNDVKYQVDTTKVSETGGGTVAMFFGIRGMETMDAGVPILGMHSPQEILSKRDLIETYKLYKVFYEN